MTRVLIVDDEPHIRELVAASLEPAGWELVLVADGEEALDLIRQSSIDLIVLDIWLEKSDGLQIAEMLSQNPETAKIPILMVSASADPSDIHSGFFHGARAYLVKPFLPRELLRAARNLLEASNLEQANRPGGDSPPSAPTPIRGW
jgi:DNA-binding response OmpR family regulator